jgi:hypothetical protein
VNRPTEQALIITVTGRGLLASCSCGDELGESVSWDSSVARHAEHVDQNHGDES